jgi:hypothetical protein
MRKSIDQNTEKASDEAFFETPGKALDRVRALPSESQAENYCHIAYDPG